MAKKKSFKQLKKSLLSWINKVKRIKVMGEPLYDIQYKIDDSNPKYLEFRFDSDLYEIINYGNEKKLRNIFFILMQKYNGEFESYSIVRFY